MKRYALVLAMVFLGVYLFGCGKKEAAQEGALEGTTMESLSLVNTEAPAVAAQPAASAQAKLEPLPAAGSFKPTDLEIQTALKNASFYSGELDGKAGPMTKKAVKEFQQANNLSVDGRVGPKTWEALSKFLNAAPVAAKGTKKR